MGSVEGEVVGGRGEGEVVEERGEGEVVHDHSCHQFAYRREDCSG